MANSKQLQYDAGRMFKISQAKTREAEKAASRAEAYEKAGDLVKADQQTKISNKYYEEALKFEKMAIKYDNDAAELDMAALEIEDQENKLQRTFNEQISKLEFRRKLLRGEI